MGRRDFGNGGICLGAMVELLDTGAIWSLYRIGFRKHVWMRLPVQSALWSDLEIEDEPSFPCGKFVALEREVESWTAGVLPARSQAVPEAGRMHGGPKSR